MMNRREALSRVSLILGGTIVGAELFLQGCATGTSTEAAAAAATGKLSATQVALLDEVGEIILPTTDTPGAKATKIGAFMNTIVSDCYEPGEQTTFIEGIAKLEEAAKTRHQTEFMQMDAATRQTFLNEIDQEAKNYEKERGQRVASRGEKPDNTGKTKMTFDPPHYFTMMKQLTIWGYFSSEIGATQALRYVEVPGRYEGCAPYTKGEKAWAI